MGDEWVEWHRQYEGDGSLPRRLKAVRERLRLALDHFAPGPIRAISMCAGDGRDLLGALEDHPRAGDVTARLVELSDELVAAGRAAAARQGLSGVEFVLGDASVTQAYDGAVPADLVLVCGVFGNISDDDIHATVGHLPELCAPGAVVIWTRGRFEPDLTPVIRAWFVEAGFREISFVPIAGTTASVGVDRLDVDPRPFVSGVRLFTFLPPNERPSRRGARRAPPPGPSQ